MKKHPDYQPSSHYRDCSAWYGSKVTAYFYVGDDIKEGEPFDDDVNTRYVDEMGPDWHKGHMLARSLGGDNNVHNMLPMKESVNNSIFKKVEIYVKKLIENLDDLQNRVGEGTLHVEYTVERVPNTPISVKGYKFPSEFSYSIKILKEDGSIVNTIKFWSALTALGITPDIKFSDTLKVDA